MSRETRRDAATSIGEVMSDRTDKEASAGELWHELKIRMDDRQASYRRGWLRGRRLGGPRPPARRRNSHPT